MTSRLSLLNSTNFETWKLNIDDVHAIKALTIISKINVKLHQPVSNAGKCLLCLNKTRKDAPRLWKKEVECLLCKTRGYKNFTFRTQLELITHNTGKLHQIDHTLQKLTETKCPVCPYRNHRKNGYTRTVKACIHCSMPINGLKLKYKVFCCL